MSEVETLRALVKKFVKVPLSLADACLVGMTELDQKSVVLIALARNRGFASR
jgi:hypothetical protein